MPKEVLSVHIGGCGTLVGSELWSRLSRKGDEDTGCVHSVSLHNNDHSYSPFFYEDVNGSRRPRAVFGDTDPSVLKLSRSFDPDDVISSNMDCRYNYFEARARATDDGFASRIVDRVCTQAERCDNLRSFFLYNSFGGGTGSGVTVEVLSQLRDQFPKQAILQPLVYPSTDSSTSAVEPYNCVFGLSATRDLASLVMMLDNQAAFKICREKQKIPDPNFADMNRLIARVVSGCTASLRSPSTVNATPDEIVMNLVPQPVFHYVVPAVAPISFSSTAVPRELVSSLFDPSMSLCDVPNLKLNRYFAATVVARGKALGSVEIQKHVHGLKSSSRNIRFVSWVPNSFKVGVVEVPSPSPEVVLLANTTAVRGLFVRQYWKFLHLLFHKAYVWQFLEAGGEMDEFEAARETIRSIIDEYAQSLTSAKSDESQALERQLNRHSF